MSAWIASTGTLDTDARSSGDAMPMGEPTVISRVDCGLSRYWKIGLIDYIDTQSSGGFPGEGDM